LCLCCYLDIFVIAKYHFVVNFIPICGYFTSLFVCVYLYDSLHLILHFVFVFFMVVLYLCLFMGFFHSLISLSHQFMKMYCYFAPVRGIVCVFVIICELSLSFCVDFWSFFHVPVAARITLWSLCLSMYVHNLHFCIFVVVYVVTFVFSSMFNATPRSIYLFYVSVLCFIVAFWCLSALKLQAQSLDRCQLNDASMIAQCGTDFSETASS